MIPLGHSTPSYSFVTEVIPPHMMPPWSIHCCVWVGATGLWELLIFCIILSFCFFFLIVSIEKMGWKGEGGKERKRGGEKIKRKGEERRGEEESKWGKGQWRGGSKGVGREGEERGRMERKGMKREEEGRGKGKVWGGEGRGGEKGRSGLLVYADWVCVGCSSVLS